MSAVIESRLSDLGDTLLRACNHRGEGYGARAAAGVWNVLSCALLERGAMMADLKVPVRLWLGQPTPTYSFVDDDWNRYYGPNPGTDDGTTHFEVHEMCGKVRAYPGQPCPWHPPTCSCSGGACQK